MCSENGNPLSFQKKEMWVGQLEGSQGMEEKRFKNRKGLFENAKENGHHRNELDYLSMINLPVTLRNSTIAPPTA